MSDCQGDVGGKSGQAPGPKKGSPLTPTPPGMASHSDSSKQHGRPS